MNDLTFGATLLSCFVMLVASVIIEVAAVPQRGGSAASRPDLVTAHAARAAKDCTRVALAPASPVDER